MVRGNAVFLLDDASRRDLRLYSTAGAEPREGRTPVREMLQRHAAAMKNAQAWWSEERAFGPPRAWGGKVFRGAADSRIRTIVTALRGSVVGEADLWPVVWLHATPDKKAGRQHFLH